MRWVKRILGFLLVFVVAFALYGFWTVRRSFPTVDGTLEVAGLQDEVEVFRNDLGVPTIYASSQHDLFFAQGFIHAQDRFWQMDFWRHIGSGRLSEMFGESQIETDMFLRTLGFRNLAEQEWAAMGTPYRQILQAYADGVNAYIESRSGPEISLEYAILPLQNSGYEIEPWTPIHTLTWARVMAWDLDGNMDAEIARATLGQSLNPDQVDQLFPPFPSDKPYIMGQSTSQPAAMSPVPDTALAAIARTGERAQALWDMTGGGFEDIGSNNWVIGGEHTDSGLPLLANDTHLGIRMPSIWYEIGLHCTDPGCPYQVVGFSFPGVPGVVIGHNENIAWGVTTEAADSQDLFIEKVNPADPRQYRADGEWVDFETRPETIRVAGGDDVEIVVLSSRHGPVISETYFDDDQPFDDSTVVDVPNDYVVSLGWQGLQPSSLFAAIISLDRASGYDEFTNALSKWDIAAQNFVYADTAGNIAYQSTGEIPVRASGTGLYPVPGWDSDFDWTGVVPFEEMPRLLNPPSGYIESANQPIWAPDETPFIGADGAYGYRGARIATMIESGTPHLVETVQRMQFDARDGSAEFVIPYLLDIDAGNLANVAALQARLEGWASGSRAFQAVGDSSGAATYMAVWRHILLNTFGDDLPEDYWPTGGSRWFEVVRNLLTSPDDPFWDDRSTEPTEGRDEILLASLIDADSELRELLGDDPGKWRWGLLHTASFENETLGQSGIGPIEWLFNRSAPKRVSGSTSIVNAVGWDTSDSYVVNWLPSQRFVADLSDWSASTFIHTTGQSGHAFHPNYDSMIAMWTDGSQAPMLWERAEISAAATDILLLTPAS